MGILKAADLVVPDGIGIVWASKFTGKRIKERVAGYDLAMNVLKEMGFVTQETYGEVHLTEAGRQKASDVYNRHEILCDFLEGVLHVSRENAENDACKIEHVVCDETINKIKEFMKK